MCRPDLDNAAFGDSAVEGGLACGRRTVHDRAVTQPIGTAMPGAGEARFPVGLAEPALVQWAAQVRAPVGKDQDL